MDLSIIIVNYKTKGLLLDCLDAIYDHQPMPVNFEVIVVDNASSDGSVEAVAATFNQVKLIVNEDNLGPAKAINKGLRIARGRYILLLSPDIIFSSKVFIKMIEFMDSHHEAGASAPLLLDLDEVARPLYGRLPTIISHFSRLSGIRKIIPDRLVKKCHMKIDTACDFMPMDWLMSACLMFRKEVLKKTGDMDENFFFYFEDMEFSYRLKDNGWKLYLIPKISVIHIQHQGIKLMPEKDRRALYRKSVAYFYYKRWIKNYFGKNLEKSILK